jgi:hypothetical protein
MTKEEILSMARESGFERLFGDVDWVSLDEDLERFAALVAEKERAKIVTLLKGSLDEDDDADLWYLAIKCMIEKIEKVDAK